MRAPWRSLEGPWNAPGSPRDSFPKESEGSLMQTFFSSVWFSCLKHRWNERFSTIGFKNQINHLMCFPVTLKDPERSLQVHGGSLAEAPGNRSCRQPAHWRSLRDPSRSLEGPERSLEVPGGSLEVPGGFLGSWGTPWRSPRVPRGF